MLVNSAGLNNLQRFWRDQTVESWDQVIRINLDGTFYCTHAVLPSMRERKDGVVINISSWARQVHLGYGRRSAQLRTGKRRAKSAKGIRSAFDRYDGVLYLPASIL